MALLLCFLSPAALCWFGRISACFSLVGKQKSTDFTSRWVSQDPKHHGVGVGWRCGGEQIALLLRGRGWQWYLLQDAGRELHGLVVLLLQHVHVQVVQKVVPVVIQPTLVQLGRGRRPHRLQKRPFLLPFYLFLGKDITLGNHISRLPPGVIPMQSACCLTLRTSLTPSSR